MSRPLLTPQQRSAFLAFSSAIYGLAIAASTYPLWLRPAPAGQLPGFMSERHLDARASYWFFAAVVATTIAVPFVLRGAVERLARADVRAWARNGAAAAMLASLWVVSVERNPAWTTIPAAVAVAVCVLLRRFDARFSRRDAILVPTIASVFLSLIDLTQMPVAPAVMASFGTVVTLRLAIAWRARTQPPLLFALSPLALLLQTSVFAGSNRYAGWPALVIALGTPLVLRFALHDTRATRRRLRLGVAIAVYPLALLAYADGTSLVTASGHPRVSFFEDGQHLVAAHEMLHGRMLYRDVIPPHGLIQDALLDAAILDSGRQTIGRVMDVRTRLALLMAVAMYAVAAAVTGSADAALLAVVTAAMFGYTTATVRFLPALATLAIAAWGVRRQSRSLLAIAGAAAIFAFLTSVDQGVYAVVAVAIATVLVRPRLRAMAFAAGGAFSVALIATLAMLAAGFLGPFLRVTFVGLPSLRTVYALTPFEVPPGFGNPLPALLTSVFDLRSFPIVAWMATLAGTAALLVRRRTQRGSRRIGPVFVIAGWVLASGLSYAERHHVYFTAALMPLIAAVMWRMWHERGSLPRIAAAALIVILLIAGLATNYAEEIASFRRARSRGPLLSGSATAPLPRASGVYFDTNDVTMLLSVDKYVRSHLSRGDTFFDFTNRALLYFLVDRDIPIPQIEVAQYEPAERQRAVIAAIERNPRVRCAIVPGPLGGTVVDDIPSPVRAPLVWQYLEEHFEPDFAEGDVVIWRRR